MNISDDLRVEMISIARSSEKLILKELKKCERINIKRDRTDCVNEKKKMKNERCSRRQK